MKQQTSGFSIVFALGLTLLLSLTGLYLVEYMIPFSRNIKGIENASQAFYKSYGWVEQSLYKIYEWDIGGSFSDEFTLDSGIAFTAQWSWSVIPSPWDGTSRYDEDRNRLSVIEPLQLYIWKNRIPSSGPSRLVFRVRIPDIDGAWGFDEEFDADQEDDIVLWQLSSENTSLFASWSLIWESEIELGVTDYRLWSQNWARLGSSAPESFGSFYDSECRWITQECILRFIVINPLVSSTNEALIPYLEYQFEVSWNIWSNPAKIPYPIVRINSQWSTSGFSKNLEVDIPRDAINSAFDFAIFQ